MFGTNLEELFKLMRNQNVAVKELVSLYFNSAISSKPRPTVVRRYVLAIITVVLLAVSLLIIALDLNQGLSDTECTHILFSSSPALDGVQYRWIFTQNVIFGARTVYVGPPRPISEAEWDFLNLSKSLDMSVPTLLRS